MVSDIERDDELADVATEVDESFIQSRPLTAVAIAVVLGALAAKLLF